MTPTASVRCTNCDWRYRVSKTDSTALEVAASAKAAAHVSTTECPYGSTEYEIDD